MAYPLEYAVWCEAHHALLGLFSALALLGGYYLTCWITATYCRGGRHISLCSYSGLFSLLALSFSAGLIGHYAADFGYLGGWWVW